MKNLLRSLLLVVAAVASTSSAVDAFAILPSSSRSSTTSTSLPMVFGPKQALTLEKTKNPAKFEQTIQGLMTTKNLTRGQAERRYGQFLVDPDGFALAAAEEERREKGYKDWIDQAVQKSDDPEATLARIKAFQRRNSIKGTAIMVVFGAAAVYFNTVYPYVPPGH